MMIDTPEGMTEEQDIDQAEGCPRLVTYIRIAGEMPPLSPREGTGDSQATVQGVHKHHRGRG